MPPRRIAPGAAGRGRVAASWTKYSMDGAYLTSCRPSLISMPASPLGLGGLRDELYNTRGSDGGRRWAARMIVPSSSMVDQWSIEPVYASLLAR